MTSTTATTNTIIIAVVVIVVVVSFCNLLLLFFTFVFYFCFLFVWLVGGLVGCWVCLFVCCCCVVCCFVVVGFFFFFWGGGGGGEGGYLTAELLSQCPIQKDMMQTNVFCTHTLCPAFIRLQAIFEQEISNQMITVIKQECHIVIISSSSTRRYSVWCRKYGPTHQTWPIYIGNSLFYFSSETRGLLLYAGPSISAVASSISIQKLGACSSKLVHLYQQKSLVFQFRK